MRRLPLLLLFAFCHASVAADIRHFLERHCLDCHDGDTSKAGLNLDRLDLTATNLPLWEKVYDRVAAAEMPPAKKPRPAADELGEFLGTVSEKLVLKWNQEYQDSGRVVGRRLNPTEYENTLRDLLSAPWLELKEMLPPDPEQHGFDNVAAAQEISYIQMAKYLEAAEVAIDGAMRLHPRPEPTTYRTWFSEEGRYLGRGEFEGKGTGRNRPVGKWMVILRQPNSAQAPFRIRKKDPTIQQAGWYRFRVKCRAVLYDNGKLKTPERGHVASINTAAKRVLGRFDVPSTPDGGVVEFTAWQHRGDFLEFFCDTLDDRDFDRRRPQAPYRGEGIAVEWFEIEGPYASPRRESENQWPAQSYRKLFGNLPLVPWTEETGIAKPEMLHLPDWTANKRGLHDSFQHPPSLMQVASQQPAKDAERLLRKFMARAYRREPEEREVDRCLAFALKAIQQKACFQDALRLSYKAALCSPDFLYFRETPGRLDHASLASRLSYFLWRTLPDAELLTADLNSEKDLLHQFDRLLSDPRSERFVSDFTGQWLDLRKVHDTSPDRYLFPEYFCDVHLVNSAVAESEATFAEMLRKDLPAITAIKSNFVMINERLAELYQIDNVRGMDIRRVALPKDSRRGGFLTQSSVLKVTANGLTTSPVIRGAWILDRLLGTPPAAPPPDAGAIEPDTRGTITIRQLLAKHSRNESCASCHQAIDPPGFALENFDVMGAWQERYRSFEHGEETDLKVANRRVRYRLGLPVDASGVTEQGQAFEDIEEFRQSLVAREEQIARNLIQRLLTFATGAGVTFADRVVVEDILRQTQSTNHGLRSIIRSIVLSETFRSK